MPMPQPQYVWPANKAQTATCSPPHDRQKNCAKHASNKRVAHDLSLAPSRNTAILERHWTYHQIRIKCKTTSSNFKFGTTRHPYNKIKGSTSGVTTRHRHWANYQTQNQQKSKTCICQTWWAHLLRAMVWIQQWRRHIRALLSSAITSAWNSC